MEGDNRVVYDFVFNGWGLKFAADKDNLITRSLYRKKVFKGMHIKHGGLVMEGGGLESDGQGTLLTTAECLLSPNRNPHLSKGQLERKIKALFGLERILWLNNGYLAGDDTDSHIDTLARFCTPDTIMYVQCNDAADEHFEALQAMEQELKSFTTDDGKPYHLVPLPMADACFDADGCRLPATYANFLLINGAVLVPVYGVKQDASALKIFESAEETEMFELAMPIPGPDTEVFSAAAKKHKVVLVTSLFEKRAPGLYHNTSVVFEKDGESVVSKIIINTMEMFGYAPSPEIAHKIALPIAFAVITVLHIVFGIVTLEDIVEVLVGDIQDEHDAEVPVVEKQPDNKWLIAAQNNLAEINEELPFDFPLDEDYETLAGLILKTLESIPEEGQVLQIGGYEIKIVKMFKTSPEMVLVHRM
ncbi:unnamed protein product [Darwinula stevensoni]|uniref:Transporter-associated domain-containing protein n=1 Tax=Darwinula stevensoni TaxID=69355 RepID=A0A7R8WZM6_9CRUS|nr:unnamed protein product [Darwinula stevensoni]CAG0880301.1 unnamed protein product [Darwinula stevensoni]